MKLYRITKRRRNPAYWQSKTETVYGTAKKAAACMAASGWAYSVTIEEAEVGDFIDVTEQFRKAA